MIVPRWPLLRSLIEARAAAAGVVSLEIFSVDHDAAGAFAREAGVAAVLDRLRRASADGKAPPAILLIGLYPEDDLRQRVAPRAGAPGLFDWPGLSYFRFVFGEDELKGGIAVAVEGRHAPPPLPTCEELALRAANIRHSLERVVNVLAGEATVFANAARGETGLSPAMLELGSALSSEHCDNLAALAAALRLAPAITDGDVLSKTLTDDVDAVCRESARLEAVKACGPAAAPAALAEAAASLSAAGQALDTRMCAIATRFAPKAQ
jgi:hypothetical protein